MSTADDIQIKESKNKDLVSTLNKKVSIKKSNLEDEKKIQNTEKINTKSCKLIHIFLIALGVAILIGAAIGIVIVIKKKKQENEEKGNNEKNKENEEEEKKKKEDEEIEENCKPIILGEINENNYIKTKVYEDFIIPSDKKIRVVGENFKDKKSTFIIGKNKNKFIIDDNGIIEGITKNDFPLYYSFNESITNGSYLFKDVKCFKEIDLSKMDSSKMIDASNMFENSNFEEIYFGTENESYTENSEYINEEREAGNQGNMTGNS